MDKHIGTCCKLVEALEQLMPEKFDFKTHHTGPDDECFRALILQLMKQAAQESDMAIEYAIACQQVVELFEPIPGDACKMNLFKYLLSNQCEIYFATIRKCRFVYTSHEDYLKHGEALQVEKNVEVYKRLKHEQRMRFNSHELAIGTIKFVAELFNVSFLNSRVMDLCMKNLLQPLEGPTTELDVECFCTLLAAIGAKLQDAPKGNEIIGAHLLTLDEIIDRLGETFVLNVRYMILSVFKLQEKNWVPQQSDQFVPVNKSNSKLIQAARETRDFLNEVNDVLSQLGKEKLLDFMYRFMDAKYSEDRLEGATKIIFERAISSPETSMFALVCKGLAEVTADKTEGAGDQVMVTFKEYLLRLIRADVDMVRQNAAAYRSIGQRLEALKVEGDKTKSDAMKAELEKDFKMSSRAVAVAAFIAELYNYDFIESRFIFDEVFIVLLNQTFFSDTSIECFCKLVTLAGTKMMTEKNRDILMKESMTRLFDAAKSINIFPKTKFMMTDIIGFARFQMKLSLDDHFKEEITAYPRLNFPWSSTLLNWSNEPLGEDRLKRIKKKKKEAQVNQSEASRQFNNQGMPTPQYMINCPPPIAPPSVPSTFAIRSSAFEYYNQVPKRLYMNSNTPRASMDTDNDNSRVVPNVMDYSQDFANRPNRNNFY